MQAKFEHDFRSVRLHRPASNSQLVSNLLIWFSLCQKSNNFNLAGGWPSLRIFQWVTLIPYLEKPLLYDVGYTGGQEKLTRSDVFHCLDEVRSKIGFQDVPKGPCFQNPAHHLVGLMHREDNNFGSWSRLSNLARHLQPVYIGHADINNVY